jgi:hypothetical protein
VRNDIREKLKTFTKADGLASVRIQDYCKQSMRHTHYTFDLQQGDISAVGPTYGF